MAHKHQCRYCEESFVCAEDAAECFAGFITCRDCFWQVEFKHFILFFILAIIVVGMTLLLVSHIKDFD